MNEANEVQGIVPSTESKNLLTLSSDEISRQLSGEEQSYWQDVNFSSATIATLDWEMKQLHAHLMSLSDELEALHHVLSE